MTTKVNPTIPSEDHPRLGPATRLLGERSASDHYLHLKHHLGAAVTAYPLLRHLTVALAALLAVVIDAPSNPVDLTMRLAAALSVILIDVALIDDSPLARRGPRVDPLLGMASLVGLGLLNPAALVPIAVALTASLLTYLGPVWVLAPAIAIQLGGTAIVGANSEVPSQMWLLLSIMTIADITKVLGTRLFNDRLHAVDERYDTMVKRNHEVAWNLTERLSYQRHHDDLTGLPNRAQTGHYLLGAIDHAVTRGDTLALLVMNLTQFWQVNDALGHRAGDELLVAVAERLLTLNPPIGFLSA